MLVSHERSQALTGRYTAFDRRHLGRCIRGHPQAKKRLGDGIARYGSQQLHHPRNAAHSGYGAPCTPERGGPDGRQGRRKIMSAQPPGGDPAAPEASAGRGTRLQRLRWPLMLVVPVLIAVAVYLYLTGGRYQSTDDAYIQAATVSISANVAGRVLDIYVHDNEIVKRGDSLYRLDDAPFRIAVS